MQEIGLLSYVRMHERLLMMLITKCMSTAQVTVTSLGWSMVGLMTAGMQATLQV